MCIAGLIAVIGAGIRLHRARHSLTPGAVYLCTSVGTIGVSAALAAPATVVLTEPFEPFPNATRLGANSLALVAAWCVQGLLVHLVMQPEQVHRAVRRQAFILAAAVSAMTILLASANTEAHPDFVAQFADEPGVLGYLLVFCAYIAIAAGNFIRLIRRYIALSDRPWLRRGLAVIQLGAVFAILWAVGKSTAAAFVFVTGSPLSIETPMSAILSASCVGLVAIGATMPAWGPLVARPPQWIRHRRAFTDLEPLWRALVTAIPEISASHTGHQARSIEEHLAQRVVEIRDGLLLLAVFRTDPPTHPHQPEQVDLDKQAAAEATQIAAALRAREAGTTPVVQAPEPPGTYLDDLDAETDWLRRIARTYRRSTAEAPVGEHP